MRIGRAGTLLALGVVSMVICISGSVSARAPAGPSGPGGPGVASVVPPLLQYQGRLTDPATGEPVDDGVHTMTFRLYDAESGGDPLWTETKDVTVDGGVFSTALGDTEALDPDLFNGQSLWLGTKVGADTEATPRQLILPVPYAVSLVPGAVVSTTSSSPTFVLINSGAGDGLEVQGTTTLNGDLSVSGSLSGGSHAHSGDDITSGTVAEARIDSQIARDSEIVPSVLDGDGSGSGLDADFLDGQDSGDFSPADHTHSGDDITSGTLSNSRFSAYSDLSSEAYLNNDASGDLLTRSQADGRYVNEQQNSSVTSSMIADGSTLDEILDDDGAGSGLDADLLDGVDASALRFITLDPYAAYLGNGATLDIGYGPNAGIFMPDSVTAHFSLGLTIPSDYIPGTKLTVQLVWHTSSTSCGIDLRPNFISVARAGRTHLDGGSATAGFEAVGGTVLYASGTANQSGAKEYTITSPDSGTDLKPGDSVIFGLYRCGYCTYDTCTGDLVVQGVGVTY